MGRPDRMPTDALIGIHVLVVDDDKDARELFRTVLQYSGALVTVVTTAAEALEAMAVVVPDVLVTDIAMPARDGYWLIERVRALPLERGGNVAAIAVTAHGSVHSVERAEGAGFQILLRKPLDPWDLCRHVAALAGRGDSGTQGASRA
ncbi:MAG: response regulator [bacterium]